MTGLDSRAVRAVALAIAGIVAAACGPSATQSASDGSSSSATPPGATVAPTSTPSRATGETSPSLGPTAVSWAIDVIVGGLANPVDVASARDGSGRLFVVEQAGLIRIVDGGRLLDRPFLDITSRIASGGERGLLGLAFHPGFPAEPRFFVDYTDLDGKTIVAEYSVDGSDTDAANANSERVLLEIDQPFPNHNGGGLAFGPDGMLYIATGDGGSGGDPQGNGRRLDTLLAKILRIDVDGETALGEPETDGPAYRIPDDNPFVGDADAAPEIWLTGLRNPWRIRFDRETGNLWIGDVGQGAWEEIDMAPAGRGGLDFGWNRMEGSHCFAPQVGCDETGLTLPVAEYGHDQGCAVIGGVVIRDRDQPWLDGSFIFSDSCSANFWLMDAAGGEPRIVLPGQAGRSISSIAEDEGGAVVATDRANGQLLSITGATR